jgi:hypothetical protein
MHNLAPGRAAIRCVAASAASLPPAPSAVAYDGIAATGGSVSYCAVVLIAALPDTPARLALALRFVLM